MASILNMLFPSTAAHPPLPSSTHLQYGVRHYEMYFPDGTCPSEQILLRFLEVAEREPGALAVRPGLGWVEQVCNSLLSPVWLGSACDGKAKAQEAAGEGCRAGTCLTLTLRPRCADPLQGGPGPHWCAHLCLHDQALWVHS